MITSKTLHDRAGMMRALGYESCAQELDAAADELTTLRKSSTISKRLDDPAYMVKSYRTELDIENKDMRVVFFGDTTHRNVLGHMILNTPESYEFAAHILKNYDELEGIK